MADTTVIAVGIIKELIGVAGAFIPPAKIDAKTILTETEAAEINTERLKLVRKLVNEVKEDVHCPSCKAHIDKVESELIYLEREVPRLERVAALRTNLKNLLEEAQKEMSNEQSFDLEHNAETVSAVVPNHLALPEKLTETKKTTEVTEVAKVKSACVPCSIGHFSTSATLLNEALRFKKDGLTSPQVMDDIAAAIGEQNALERIDLTAGKISNLPEAEKAMANKALEKSRELRHKLETVKSIDQLEEYAAETENFYKELNRGWLSKRLSAELEKKS